MNEEVTIPKVVYVAKRLFFTLTSLPSWAISQGHMREPSGGGPAIVAKFGGQTENSMLLTVDFWFGLWPSTVGSFD